MDNILKVKSMSLWIFIVPFFAINACLILITQFHGLFPNPEHILHDTIPYIDGKASISRTARVFPTYLIFKPAMFLTAFLLIKYWLMASKSGSMPNPSPLGRYAKGGSILIGLLLFIFNYKKKSFV